ncbi:unnamed protein product, partial [Effrenium voratum]
MLTVCHTARVALRVPKVQGSAPSQGRCETCGGEAHLGLPEVGPEDVLGIVSSSPLATQWREVLLEADLEERPSLAPLRVCASLEEEKAELELRVVADPLALAQRARLAIYPPWRLGPHLRFSWRLEAREETPPAVPAPELRQKPRRPRALTGIGGVSGGFGGGSDSSFDVHMDPELLETQAAPQPFQLLSHLEEAEAPEGLQLPLRAHQLQSLAWMQACEGEREPLLLGASREFLPALQPPHAAQQALVEAVKCRAVARVQRAFEVRGGVLADQVGSGKTAVTLALVVSDRNSHQASRTLVLAPGRLLQQWQHEAWKFLDRGMQVLDEDLRVAPVEPGEPQLLVAPVELLSSKRRLEEDSFATRLRRLQLSRLVVDEFHELSDGALAQLRPPSPATAPMALWGLTGTPALEGFGSVARLAQVFAVELGVFRRQLDAAALAQKALDYLARAQGAGCRLTSHPVHEELVTLHHTPAERALYAQHAAEARKGRLAAPELLQLCSHFHLTEKDTDAEAESAQLLRARQDAKATAKEWLALAAAKVAQQVPRMIKAAESEVLAEQYAQLLAEVGTAPHAEHAQLAGARAAGARQNAGRHEREADALILEAMRVEEASEESQGASQGAEVFGDGLELLEDLKQAKEAFRQRSCEVAFLSAMLDAAENQSFRCPICLNEPEPTERAILAACAHLFCLQCASTLARSRVPLGVAHGLCVLFLALWGLQRYVPAWLPVRRGMLALPLLWPGVAVADGSDTPEPDAALPAPAAPAAPAAPGPTVLQLRFNGTEVEKLPSGFIPGWGPDDLYYPRWMEGRWRVEQTLEGYAAPMGKQFLANGRGEVADKVLAEQQSQLGQAVSFELRYIRTQRNNIVEDRAFNTRAKLNAFAGREVVKSVEYVEVPDNTRESALQAGNSEADPLRTVVANFKGAV